MRFLKLTILAAFAAVLTIIACQKDEKFTTDASAKLSFSSDTLRFDTVFTSLGSATRLVKIFNKNNQAVRIAKIYLAGQTAATFNLNIDGVSAKSFTNVEIPANDSLYCFAEVTINPNAPLSISPFVVDEGLIFETNGNKQTVVLEAFGQNANYIPNRWAGGKETVLDAKGGEIVWNDAKPYVIYGALGISNGTLRLAAGTRIHVHGGLARPNDSTLYRDGILYFFNTANLVANGTLDRPVIIESDRLEKEFADVAGQWRGVFLSSGSRGSALTYTTIRNSQVGISADSASSVSLKSCRIYNTASSGLLPQHATVTAENCLFYNNGGNSVQIEFGGSYDFKHCTMASFGQYPALGVNNYRCYAQDAVGNCVRALAYPLSISVTNCIVYGSKEDQVDLYDAAKDRPNYFNFAFQNCIVRVKDLLLAKNYPNFLTANCKDCINANTTVKLFKKSSDDNYHLDTLSIAEQKALPIPTIPIDLDGKLRDVLKPDIGCYEYYK